MAVTEPSLGATGWNTWGHAVTTIVNTVETAPARLDALETVVEQALPPTGFVYQRGTRLLLDGDDYLVLGTNVYDLLDSTTTEANTRLTELQGHGINAVRCWAFSNDGTAGTALRSRLATALTNAAAKNIKLLLSLGNQWNDWGGPDKFGLTQTTWYQTLDETWLAQIETLVTQFKDDPAVLGWEILNEPRPANDVVSMQWLEVAGGRIKQIDPHHIVVSGSEGFVPFHYPTAVAESGASPDINLHQLNQSGSVDVASAHFYSKYLTPDFAPDPAGTYAAAQTMKTFADNLDKPLIVGEVGFDPNDHAGGTTSRSEFIHHVAAAVHLVGASGGFLWNWGRLADLGSFTLAEGDASSEALIDDWVATLTSGDPTSVRPTTVTLQVGATGDDSFHSFNGVSTHTYNTTANDIPVGLFDATQTALGAAMRFTSVTVPNGATITNARLTLVASSSDTATTVRSRIRAVDADNAALPTNDAAFHTPPFTTAVVSWDSIPAWTNGQIYVSPDITTVIQELVDRAGWASGNAMCLIWDDLEQRSTQSSNVLRRARSYNNSPTEAPVLTISYVT